MANKPKSLYLNDRAMSVLRPADTLSGRMNRVVDRYLEWLDSERAAVTALFSSDEMQTLTAAWTPSDDRVVTAAELRDELIARLAAHPPLADRIEGVTFGTLLVLVELLEERISLQAQ